MPGEVEPYNEGPNYADFYIPLGEKPELEAVVWASKGHGPRVVKITAFSDPNEIVEGELVDDESDHDHSKCCTYNFCAHPMCCGYRGEEGRSR